MIKKYRKKPVEIEAIQLKDFSQYTIKSCLEFMGQEVNTNSEFDSFCSMVKAIKGLTFETVDGRTMKVSKGDYIIKVSEDEFYPWKPDIFLKTYEEVNELSELEQLKADLRGKENEIEVLKWRVKYLNQFKPILNEQVIPNTNSHCDSCSNNIKNGGSGVCNCLFGGFSIR